MKQRITNYMNYIDNILNTWEEENHLNKNQSENDQPNTDIENLKKEHLIQIGFFAHERLVHLIVTVVFAMLAFGTFFLLYLDFSVELCILLFAVLCLLVPYIFHYFLLENGVQYMYTQYDKMCNIEQIH